MSNYCHRCHRCHHTMHTSASTCDIHGIHSITYHLPTIYYQRHAANQPTSHWKSPQDPETMAHVASSRLPYLGSPRSVDSTTVYTPPHHIYTIQIVLIVYFSDQCIHTWYMIQRDEAARMTWMATGSCMIGHTVPACQSPHCTKYICMYIQVL